MIVHLKTATIATYTTGPGRVHEVSTTTRHGGYDVATIVQGCVDPRTIRTYPSREEAIAEIERRALADYQADHPDAELGEEAAR